MAKIITLDDLNKQGSSEGFEELMRAIAKDFITLREEVQRINHGTQTALLNTEAIYLILMDKLGITIEDIEAKVKEILDRNMEQVN